MIAGASRNKICTYLRRVRSAAWFREAEFLERE